MPRHPFLNGCYLVGDSFLGFLHSSSSSPVSCSHLSPTASNSNLPYLKVANCIKLWMQSGCSLVYFSPCKAWTMQMSMNNNSINIQWSTSLATNLHSFMSQFLYFLETLSVFWEIHMYIRTVSQFHYKYSQIRTGRQVCFSSKQSKQQHAWVCARTHAHTHKHNVIHTYTITQPESEEACHSLRILISSASVRTRSPALWCTKSKLINK